jgi:hypothetical protein
MFVGLRIFSVWSVMEFLPRFAKAWGKTDEKLSAEAFGNMALL